MSQSPQTVGTRGFTLKGTFTITGTPWSQTARIWEVLLWVYCLSHTNLHTRPIYTPHPLNRRRSTLQLHHRNFSSELNSNMPYHCNNQQPITLKSTPACTAMYQSQSCEYCEVHASDSNNNSCKDTLLRKVFKVQCYYGRYVNVHYCQEDPQPHSTIVKPHTACDQHWLI